MDSLYLLEDEENVACIPEDVYYQICDYMKEDVYLFGIS